MAPNKPAVDLNAMLQKDRQRRKDEAIAQKILGSNRRASAPGAAGLNNRKSVGVPSLASRITPAGGIAKRNVPTTTKPSRASPRPNGNVNADWTHDLHSLNNPTADTGLNVPRGPRASRPNRNTRLQNVIHGSASSPALNSQFNIVGSAKPASSMTIRGLAGPYLVMAKNLALGTTAADIESAMSPVGGAILGCRLIAERPKVIAELIFETKEGADNVVDTFNNQNADGNILQVYHKPGPVPQGYKNSASAKPLSPAARTPRGPRADLLTERSDESRYSSGRERSRDRGRDYGRDEVMDGSYGFDDRMETDNEETRGLYSDTIISGRGRGGGNSRDRGGRGDRSRGYR